MVNKGEETRKTSSEESRNGGNVMEEIEYRSRMSGICEMRRCFNQVDCRFDTLETRRRKRR